MRVWLTEREIPKRQVHYFDDTNVAKGMRGDSHFVPMQYMILGESGAARGLDLSFHDESGQRIDWRVTYPADATLSSQFAGLKPQGGHAADEVFLLFVLGPNATTYDSLVTIGDKLFPVTRENIAADKRYYGSAHTQGAHNFVINYAKARVTRSGDTIHSSWAGGRTFTASPGNPDLLRSTPFGFAGAGRVEIERGTSGTVSYRHRFGAHDATILMKDGRFATSFDGAAPVMSGTFREEGAGEQFVLTPDEPRWSRGIALRGKATPTGDGYELEISREGRSL
jgi:hypothetical protein